MKRITSIVAPIILSCSLFSFGCSQGQQSHYSRDNYATWGGFPIHVQMINPEIETEAIEAFNTIYGETIFQAVDGVDEADVLVEYFDFDNQSTDGRATSYKSDDDKHIIISGKIELDDAYADDFKPRYVLVFAHELGHILGYEWHSEEEGVLMYYNVYGADVYDKICSDIEFNDWIFEAYGLTASPEICENY